MGGRESISATCENNTLTFNFPDKTYSGSICNEENRKGKKWKLEGNNEDELYLVIDKKYMIDVYKKNIAGKQTEVLRLKIISSKPQEPSVGYIYVPEK